MNRPYRPRFRQEWSGTTQYPAATIRHPRPEQTVDSAFLAQLRRRPTLPRTRCPRRPVRRLATVHDTTFPLRRRWPAAGDPAPAVEDRWRKPTPSDPDALAIWVSRVRRAQRRAGGISRYACVCSATRRLPHERPRRGILETFLHPGGGGGGARPPLGLNSILCCRPPSATARRSHTRNAYTTRHSPSRLPCPRCSPAGARTPQRTRAAGRRRHAQLCRAGRQVQAVADALRAAGVRTDERAALLVARGPPPSAGDPRRAASRRRLFADQS
ncbi:hypothetical protein ACPA9J_31530 [Pseudomonas aeruginosa]